MKITTKTTTQGRQLIFEPSQNELPSHITDGMKFISFLMSLLLVWLTHDWAYRKLHSFRGQSSTNKIDIFIASIIDHITSYGVAFWLYFVISSFIIEATYLFFIKKRAMQNPAPIITTVKVNPGFIPQAQDYPHFRLIPIATDTCTYHCLYLFLDPQRRMLLVARAKRHSIIKQLAQWNEHASLTIFETIAR